MRIAGDIMGLLRHGSNLGIQSHVLQPKPRALLQDQLGRPRAHERLCAIFVLSGNLASLSWICEENAQVKWMHIGLNRPKC